MGGQDWYFERQVRYYETDRMGVVHHSNYLRLLEDARMDWMDANVMEYAALEAAGVIIPAVSAAGEFKDFLRFGDRFRVYPRLILFTGVRMKLEYEVTNAATGAVCYLGQTSHCFVRDGDYHPISIKRSCPELYEKLNALLEPARITLHL